MTPEIQKALDVIGIAYMPEQSKAAKAFLDSVGVCPCATCLDAQEHECSPLPYSSTRMILCPTCGNKRCPHATHHGNPCTGSNEPGQDGSRYGGKPPVASMEEGKQ